MLNHKEEKISTSREIWRTFFGTILLSIFGTGIYFWIKFLIWGSKKLIGLF